ncbi:MaoC-like domain-containing protein [Bordetella sputigena]|uniref:MaoC/PaaZ C-terminal domain-containing protein n=1 Tax=Bordetella sputigena TaxID=1416810 RepID=UPI0039F12FAD
MNPVSYHDLVVGASYRSTARTLTQTDLSLSCMLSGDWHPIHADDSYCREHGVPGPMFHGPYGILLAMGMSTRLPEFAEPVIGALGLKEWQYRRPLVPGDTVHVRTSINAKRIASGGRRAIVERHFALVDIQSRIVQEGYASTLLLLDPEEHTA